MKKKLLSTLVVSSIIVSSTLLPIVSLADEYDTKIQEQDKKIEELKKKESLSEVELAEIEGEMLKTAKKVDELTKKQNKLLDEIKKAYDEISNLNVRIQKRDVQMQKQARDVQVSGGMTNYIDVVINAESLSDAVTRIHNITTLVNANKSLLNQQLNDKQTVEEKMQDVETQVISLDTAKSELDEKTASLNTLKIQHEIAKNELEAQRSTEENKKTAFIAQKAAAQKRLAEEQERQKKAVEQAKKAEEEQEKIARLVAQREAEILEEANRPTTPGITMPDMPNTEATPPAGVTPAKQAAINAALADVGNRYPTGWNQPGECLVSVRRWLAAGGINFGYGGVRSGYTGSGAVEVSWGNVQPGDVIQYENIYSPDGWLDGVHTVLIIGLNGDGTAKIVEANNPGGSGYVSSNGRWSPMPPAGFRAVVWRFPG